jgi:hypothetical protein
MLERRIILVPLFLIAQIALVHWASRWERPPASLDLSNFPSELGGWRWMRADPIADVAPGLVADRLLSWGYFHPSNGSAANLFVAWYRSQLAGNSQPHSPRMCLPGSGWLPEKTGEVTLDTADGAITVNRWVISKGAQRAAVLFWYQRPRRASPASGRPNSGWRLTPCGTSAPIRPWCASWSGPSVEATMRPWPMLPDLQKICTRCCGNAWRANVSRRDTVSKKSMRTLLLSLLLLAPAFAGDEQFNGRWNIKRSTNRATAPGGWR